jgi:Fe-Mn family superoxide dismutase
MTARPKELAMIVLPPLPYPYDSLAPVMSAATLTTHHDRHHAKYVETARALAAEAGLGDLPLEEVIARAAGLSDRRLFNNAAQAWNHAFFWNAMAARPSHPQGRLDRAIAAQFGDPGRLRAQFVEAGAAHFGSGWVWLVSEDGALSVLTTHDADTAARRHLTPLLVCDVWEHAYYLDHHQDRRGFLEAWWDRLANWDFAGRQYAASLGRGEAWTYPLGADAYVPPIHEPCALERALEEAGLLLDADPSPDSAAGRRFGLLLERIAHYHAARPQSAPRPPVSTELDRRIRAAAESAARRHPDDDRHWAPMVGGDLRHA